MKVFWNENYTSIRHDFDTSRKSDNVVRLIKEDQDLPKKLGLLKDIPNIEITDPESVTDISVTEKLINKWLDSQYVDALKTNNNERLARSQGFEWCPNTYNFARAHTHGLIASVDQVLANGGRSGSLSSGLHHASPSSGTGFCTINGLALSAIHAFEKGLDPIVLDFDAHCGGGTMSFLTKFNKTVTTIEKRPITHIDLSTNWFDGYTPVEPWSSLRVLENSEDYLQVIFEVLESVKPFITEKTIFIYNAGIDPMGSHGIDDLVIAGREKIVSEFIGNRKAIFALAGGYSGMSTTRDDVANMHLKTIYGWSWQTK